MEEEPDFILRLLWTKSTPPTPYADLLKDLAAAGLKHNLFYDGSDIFIAIRCSDARLKKEFLQSRIVDWMNGVGSINLDIESEVSKNMLLLAVSERRRHIHQILLKSREHDGIDLGRRAFSVDLFSLHTALSHSVTPTMYNRIYSKAVVPLMKSKKLWFAAEDLNAIKDEYGASIALYLGFVQQYFLALLVPSILGIIAYYYKEQYAPWVAAASSLWSVVFVETWARQEESLASDWNLLRVTEVRRRHSSYRSDMKRSTVWIRRILSLFVILAMVAVLAAFLVAISVFQIAVDELYRGPLRSIVSLIPTLVYTLSITVILTLFTSIARKLTMLENYQTEDEFSGKIAQKIYLFNSIVNFAPPLLYALLYIPFSSTVNRLAKTLLSPDVQITVEAEMFQAAIARFITVGQAINFCQEVVVPYAMQLFMSRISNGAKKAAMSPIRELPLTDRIVRESALPPYDVHDDYAEMTTQFGYICLFATAWPLVALFALINNWIEVRSDMAKICFNVRRPIPERAESIGPWLSIMRTMTWVGTISNTMWILMFRGSDLKATRDSFFNLDVFTTLQAVLILVAVEHAYFIVVAFVRAVLEELPRPAMLRRREQDRRVKTKILANASQLLEREDISPSEGKSKATANEADLERYVAEIKAAVHCE